MLHRPILLYIRENIMSDSPSLFNEDICLAMLKFFKTQTGRLTADRVEEFKAYVLKEVASSATYHLITTLQIMRKSDISKYVNKRCGEFYTTFYKDGKTKLIKTLQEHLNSAEKQDA